jgi:tRNA(His) 5'-end guanylyltransferase
MMSLSDKFKDEFESKTRIMMPPKTWTVIRLDGRAFTSYTSRLQKPFDMGFVEDLNAAIIDLVDGAQGVQFAYAQSDEVTLFLNDYAKNGSQIWFGGNLQKLCSISAAILSSAFNRYRFKRESIDTKLAAFDSRVFTIESDSDVSEYLMWRQGDSRRNAINCIAMQHFSTKQLHKVCTAQKITMLQERGVEIRQFDPSLIYGRILKRVPRTVAVPELHIKHIGSDTIERNVWEWGTAPLFNTHTSLSSITGHAQ